MRMDDKLTIQYIPPVEFGPLSDEEKKSFLSKGCGVNGCGQRGGSFFGSNIIMLCRKCLSTLYEIDPSSVFEVRELSKPAAPPAVREKMEKR
jgi:hypothetical protein